MEHAVEFRDGYRPLQRLLTAATIALASFSVACSKPPQDQAATQDRSFQGHRTGPATKAFAALAAKLPSPPVQSHAPLGNADRSHVMALGDPLRPAEDMLNSGDPDKADEMFFNANVPPERHEATDVVELREAIGKASDELMNRNHSSDFNEHLADDLKPQIAAIPISAPTNADDLWWREQQFESVAAELAGAPITGMSTFDLANLEKVKRLLASKQRVAFPNLRRGYEAIAGSAMFRMNVNVKVMGEGNRTVRWISAIFSANDNIQDAQNGVQPNISKLRFNRSEYAWIDGNPRVAYAIKSPTDGDIGYWDGAAFKFLK